MSGNCQTALQIFSIALLIITARSAAVPLPGGVLALGDGGDHRLLGGPE